MCACSSRGLSPTDPSPQESGGDYRAAATGTGPEPVLELLQRGSASTARWRSQWSASTRHTIASTIGTARGSTQGS